MVKEHLIIFLIECRYSGAHSSTIDHTKPFGSISPVGSYDIHSTCRQPKKKCIKFFCLLVGGALKKMYQRMFKKKKGVSSSSSVLADVLMLFVAQLLTEVLILFIAQLPTGCGAEVS